MSAISVGEPARDTALRGSVSAEEVRGALERSFRSKSVYDSMTGLSVFMQSPREEAIASLK